MEEGTAIPPTPKKMRLEDEEQKYVVQGIRADAKVDIHPLLVDKSTDEYWEMFKKRCVGLRIPFSDKSEEDEYWKKLRKKLLEGEEYWKKIKKKMREDVRGPNFSTGDLPLESEVDLGEGRIEQGAYPPPWYDEVYKESVDDAKADVCQLTADLQSIVKLANDEIPEDLRLWRRRYMPFRTREEEALYRHVLKKTDGFEVPFFPNSSPNFGDSVSFSYRNLHSPKFAVYTDYVKQAIDEYNKKKDTCYSFKYKIKMCSNMHKYSIIFALTDPEHHQYVGRVKVVYSSGPTEPPVIDEMRVTRGEYRVPNWKDVKGEEYKCIINEEHRKKLPEVEKKWKLKRELGEELGDELGDDLEDEYGDDLEEEDGDDLEDEDGDEYGAVEAAGAGEEYRKRLPELGVVHSELTDNL